MPFAKKDTGVITIPAPRFEEVVIAIVGTSLLVSNKFSEEARNTMQADMEKSAAEKKLAKSKSANRPPKDFEKEAEGSLHKSTEGWYGMPCTALKSAMVRAASLCGMEMTKAKMSLFVVPDGVDNDGMGLVQIHKAKPTRLDSYVRNSNGGADIRARGVYAAGWEMHPTIRYDADMLTRDSVFNLMLRAGCQVGIGAGRPFSTASVGQGWGTFELVTTAKRKTA